MLDGGGRLEIQPGILRLVSELCRAADECSRDNQDSTFFSHHQISLFLWRVRFTTCSLVIRSEHQELNIFEERKDRRKKTEVSKIKTDLTHRERP